MVESTAHERIQGSCHCGNIRVAFDWPAPGSTIPVRACGCTLCRKHGGVWTSHPDGRFTMQTADERQVNLYRFGTKTADFHICRNCGVIPIVTCILDGTRYAVVNINAFNDIDRTRFDRQDADFDSEGTDDRLARRKRNWTPEARDI